MVQSHENTIPVLRRGGTVSGVNPGEALVFGLSDFFGVLKLDASDVSFSSFSTSIFSASSFSSFTGVLFSLAGVLFFPLAFLLSFFSFGVFLAFEEESFSAFSSLSSSSQFSLVFFGVSFDLFSFSSSDLLDGLLPRKKKTCKKNVINVYTLAGKYTWSIKGARSRCHPRRETAKYIH